MEHNNSKYNTALHIFITILFIAVHFIPFVVFIPLLLLQNLLIIDFSMDKLGLVVILLIFIIAAAYIGGVILAPIVQIVFAVIATIHKKRKLLVANIVALIIDCMCIFIGLYIFFNYLIYAT